MPFHYGPQVTLKETEEYLYEKRGDDSNENEYKPYYKDQDRDENEYKKPYEAAYEKHEGDTDDFV